MTQLLRPTKPHQILTQIRLSLEWEILAVCWLKVFGLLGLTHSLEILDLAEKSSTLQVSDLNSLEAVSGWQTAVSYWHAAGVYWRQEATAYWRKYIHTDWLAVSHRLYL